MPVFRLSHLTNRHKWVIILGQAKENSVNKKQKKLQIVVNQVTEWANTRADSLNSKKQHLNAAALRAEFAEWSEALDDPSIPINVISL